MSEEREPWAGPDTEAHRLVHQAQAEVLAAARQLRRAARFGSWTGPWTDTVELLRSVATGLRRLEEIGGADPAEAAEWEPCYWCGRPAGERVQGRSGHRRCAVRAHDAPASGTEPDAEALTRFARAVQLRFPDATGQEIAEMFTSAVADSGTQATHLGAAALEGSETEAAAAPADTTANRSAATAEAASGQPAPQADAADGQATEAQTGNAAEAAPEEPARAQESGPDERDLDELEIATRTIRHADAFPDATDADIAVGLQLFHQELTVSGTAVHLVRSPAHSGRVLYDRLVAVNGAKMKAPEALRSEKVWAITGPGHARGEGLVRPLGFVNSELLPRVGQWITQTDVNAQYLAVVETPLGDGEPQELDLAAIRALSDADREDVLKSPGYAHVAGKPDLSGAPVWVRASLAHVTAGSWVALPVVAYLRKTHGIQLRLDEIIYWGAGHRGPRLRAWGRPVRTAREKLLGMGVESLPVLYAAHLIKAVYAGFLGGETRSKKHNRTADGEASGTLRPDWNDMIVATARLNVFRALDKFAAPLEIAPLGGVTDSLWWLADNPEPFTPAGWEMPDNRQPGKWKLDRHVQVTEEIVAAHATGSQARLNQAIKDEWDRMQALRGDDR
ncbi:hypothetical protein L3Q65_00345 (plasmid) [Amycolatopsis sp. FU40]|uniref:hypothetical protein n=1 Tax=Amycolatopsis sp. FU40 TaxID=2914159 RepID=UPI001F3E0781|nr:hypothetical protein [Amycolatopsis sp. FU40]UKD50779.1 hypothetical protein L3Q65_00345 [Amycolatopsis sp. FU40]